MRGTGLGRVAASLALGVTFGNCHPYGPVGSGEDPGRRIAAEVPAAPASLVHRGVALPLDLREAGGAYDAWLWEIAATGANSVSLVVTASQRDVRASCLSFDGERTVRDADLRRAIRTAHALDLRVLLFPILWLEERAEGEWRGRLVPDEPGAWFTCYRAFVLHYASIAEEEGVALFSVGSELGSLESLQERWRALIADTRRVYGGELVYSANWDHAHRTPFWDALDWVGVTGYFEVPVEGMADPIARSRARVDAWASHIEGLVALRERWGRPILITELGYPSGEHAAERPWDYTAADEVDLLLPDELFRAFIVAWQGQEALGGVFIWHWFGAGGPTDAGYSPRHKPSEMVLRAWFARSGHARATADDEGSR